VNTGIKTHILSGLEHERAIHDEVLTNLSVTHPVGAQLGRLLLQLSCALVEFMVTDLDFFGQNTCQEEGIFNPLRHYSCFAPSCGIF
jgi:hypothetical protein